MKIFKFFLATLAFVTLISCSEDDDNLTIDASVVVGEWNLDEYNYTSSTTVTQGQNSYSSSDIGEAVNLDARVIFKNNNTYQTEGSYTLKHSTTVDGETTVSNTNFNLDGSGTYRIEGNQFTVGNAEQTGVDDALAFNKITITELTANRMVWSMKETVTTQMEGASVSVAIDAIQVFSR